LHRRHTGPDRLDRFVQFLLTTPGNVNMSPLCDEPSGACQTNATVGAGDDRYLSLKSAPAILTP